LAQMKVRRDQRLRIVAFHANLEKKFTRNLAGLERMIEAAKSQGEPGPYADLGSMRRFIDHCSRMRAKWERAAARPWSSVEADPPQPNPYWFDPPPPPVPTKGSRVRG
jgi:hypothetical protein